MKKILFFILCIFLFTANNCFSENRLPKQSAVPGGIVIIPISSANTARPIAFYHKHRIMILNSNDKWTAIVGISLSAKPGMDSITVQDNIIKFNIKDKIYPEQHLHIKNKQLVTPNKQNMKRIEKEYAKTIDVLGQWTDKDIIDMHFALPVHGILTSPFGLKRFYNGLERSSHKGIDITSKKDSPIRACADGVVTNTGDYFFTGSTVYVDHGQSLFSLYCHMDKIFVKPGDHIKKGQLIGLLGSTGRATGPNLHWGVMLNHVAVNPLLFTGSI